MFHKRTPTAFRFRSDIFRMDCETAVLTRYARRSICACCVCSVGHPTRRVRMNRLHNPCESWSNHWQLELILNLRLTTYLPVVSQWKTHRVNRVGREAGYRAVIRDRRGSEVLCPRAGTNSGIRQGGRLHHYYSHHQLRMVNKPTRLAR